jgi:hypothetical protein
VELFFKWIKHLRIRQFYGTSENAVKTQIWIAVAGRDRQDSAPAPAEVLLYALLQVFSVTVFERCPSRLQFWRLPTIPNSQQPTTS